MNLEKERIKLEVVKMDSAMAEMKFRILERQQDIARLEENIKSCEDNKRAKLEELEGMED